MQVAKHVVTVAERKAREIARLRAAGDAAIDDLRALARAEGLRLAVFGSFARGDLTAGSDFDVMVDGPDATLRPARVAIEAICEHHGLRPDVHLAPDSAPALHDRVTRDGLVLP